MKRKNITKRIAVLCLAVWVVLSGMGAPFCAAEEVTINEGDAAMTVSPMRRSITLNPGDEYRGTLSIANPGSAVEDLPYKLEIKPFYVDENNQPVFGEAGNSTQMAKWVTLISPEKGVVHPNESVEVEYNIKVPSDAPAGGQYASIIVSTDFKAGTDGGVNIGEALSIAHLLLVEVTGEIREGGEIEEIGIDGFLLDGKVRAYATVNNTGNVHLPAVYKMEVYPLFSPDLLYGGKGTEEVHYILPDATLKNETVWSDTPVIGLFNVSYTVEYRDEVREVSKLVIVCPWWMLMLMIILLIILILRIVTYMWIRKNKKHE